MVLQEIADLDIAEVDAKVERLSRAALIVAENPEFADLAHQITDEIADLIWDVVGMMCATDGDTRAALAQKRRRLGAIHRGLTGLRTSTAQKRTMFVREERMNPSRSALYSA